VALRAHDEALKLVPNNVGDESTEIAPFDGPRASFGCQPEAIVIIAGSAAETCSQLWRLPALQRAPPPSWRALWPPKAHPRLQGPNGCQQASRELTEVAGGKRG
jgi:hypothetical protein